MSLNQKPAHIVRFEKMMARGRALYLISTGLMVAGVIAAIQFSSQQSLSYKTIALYALVAMVIAQVDWLIMARRYRKHQNPQTK